jgi:aspartyl-tRNA(Asn)/glutamyl-tRNA(Gln) amidotransferase subunit C
MSKLTKEQVLQIASLARLELRDDEVEKYREQLSEILEYVAKLQAADTTGAGEDWAKSPILNGWREDEVRACTADERRLILENMPDKFGDELRTIGIFKK